jgi:hypothetical protein
MTERAIAAVLHDLVDNTPVPPPPAGLWRRGRRRRLIRTTAALTAAGIAALAVAVPLAAGRRAAAPTPPATPPPSIPSVVYAPLPWQQSAHDSPPGPAAVIVSGHGPFRGSDVLDNYEGRTVVVGQTGQYRLIEGVNEGEVATEMLLSPDGRFVAVPGPVVGADDLDWGDTALVDLTTGRIRTLDGVPVAWTPDSRRLALRRDGGGPTLLVDVESGQAGIQLPSPRGRVAFSADQRMVAVERDGRLYIVDGTTGAQRASWQIGPRRYLAGSGAWTADGRLALWERVSGCEPSCDWWTNSEFRLVFVDPASERDVGGAEFDRIHSQVPLLFGWHPNGDAIVTAYRQAPLTNPTTIEWGGADGYGLRVLGLRPGGGQTELIQVPRDVHSVDLARDLVVAGRFGGEPPSHGARVRDWLGGHTWQVTAVTVGLALGIVIWRRRRAWANGLGRR